MLKEVCYALRLLRQTPLFTAAVVLTVALAIAANTTMFSVVNAVLLKPLPFHEPNRIVQVAEKNAQRVSIRGVADRLDWHLRRAGVFGGSAHR